MTASLYWRPKHGGDRLPDELRLMLRGNFNLNGVQVSRKMSPRFVGYLEGLRDQGVDGAEELLGILDEHGTIILELKS